MKNKTNDKAEKSNNLKSKIALTIAGTSLVGLIGCNTTQPPIVVRNPEVLLGTTMQLHSAVNPNLTPQQAAALGIAGNTLANEGYFEEQNKADIEAARAGRDVIIIQQGEQMYEVERIGNTVIRTPIRTKKYDKEYGGVKEQPRYKVERIGNTVIRTPIRHRN